MITLATVYLVFSWLLEFQKVNAFGAFAHKLIAKLTWQQLADPTKVAINELLPVNMTFTKLSFWADTIKHRPEYAWSKPLHFANLQDYPPFYCQRILSPESPHNVMTAALNYSQRLLMGGGDGFEDLAFAVHFIMDFHMPLHLSGLHRGGLSVKLIDDQSVKPRNVTLHYLVDSLIFHRIVLRSPFNGSYSRFFQAMSRLSSRKSECIKDIHDFEHCFEEWAIQSNLLNCQHFWRLPPDQTVSSYVNLHQRALLRLIRRTAAHLASVLETIFTFIAS